MPHSTQRPRFLNLLAIRMPVGAVTSIAHRLSGVLMFLSLPLAAFLLELSLKDEAGFRAAAALLDAPAAKLLVLILSWALMHHLFAGIRFLLLDLEIGLEKAKARRMAWVASLAAPLAALVLAWRLW